MTLAQRVRSLLGIALADKGAGNFVADALFRSAGKLVSQAYQTATVAAGDLTGANVVTFINTGTTPGNITTRTAAQMYSDIPNCYPGYSYTLMIRNNSGSANTLTLVAGTNVTLVGTVTVAQNVTRTFNVTFVDSTHCTITSLGTSAAGA